MTTLRLILVDQLSKKISSLNSVDKENDIIMLCEVLEEATYVRHHKKKLVFLLSAMRHFALSLEKSGFNVLYTKIDENVNSYEEVIRRTLSTHKITKIIIAFPGEYRILEKINSWHKLFQVEVELREDAAYNLEGDVSSFESTIGFNADEISDGEYLTHNGIIDANLNEPTITSELDLLRSGQVVGMDNFENYGYGTYFSNGYGKYIYEENGSFKSKGIRAFIVTKKRSIISTDFDANGYEFTYVTSSYDKELIVQDLHQSASVIGGDIISAVTASGYLRTHYSVTGDKHLGLQNSFYRGSKQNNFTTVDGKAPVETFVSNPTTLRISPQGRSNSEPILEVE